MGQSETPESRDENQLRFCHYENGKFVNSPLTVVPTTETAERTEEAVKNTVEVMPPV